MRWHIGAFPGLRGYATDYGTPGFAESMVRPVTTGLESDVAETATRLSIAFPRLARRVIAVAMDGLFTVRLECEGLHEGMWGDFIGPTMRRISFEEQHEMVALDRRIVSDRVTVDIASS